MLIMVIFEQNFLFVAHFVSGKPLCPPLHDMITVMFNGVLTLTDIRLPTGLEKKSFTR